MKTLTAYKCRAECFTDVARWFLATDLPGFFCEPAIKGHKTYADVTVEFRSLASLRDLRESMRKVADCHVMAETLALASEYTGERNR